jgi:hypothetical protein
MKLRFAAALMAVVLTLAGCVDLEQVRNEEEAAAAAARAAAEREEAEKVAVAPVPPPAPAKPPPPPPELARLKEIEALLTEFERLRRVPPTEIAREQEAARQVFNQNRSDATRMRLAMALAVPGVPGSEAAALELLEPLVKNPTLSLHGLAFLLAAYIQEQRRLAAQLQGLQQNVQGLQQNVQALQQKLDALRTLERSLTEREAPAGAVRRR